MKPIHRHIAEAVSIFATLMLLVLALAAGAELDRRGYEIRQVHPYLIA
ncbi:MAG: hypothetical protein R3C60_05910 [Parvularculaceae bacterium]